jgi:TRAP-type C4-dicarboxylate transport system substrate-binding protein
MKGHCIGIAVLGLGLSAAGTGVQAETVLRLSNWIPPTHGVSKALEAWAADVNTATGKRVRVDVLSALGPPPAHLSLVQNGVAQVAMSVHNYTDNRFPAEYGVTLPFQARTATGASLALWRTHGKFFQKLNSYAGVRLLGLDTHGPGAIFTATLPIRRLADVERRKFRVAGGITADVAAALGLTPVSAPASQAYDIMSKGVADGILFPAESVPGFRIERVIGHAMTAPGGFYRSSNYLMMNEAAWNALSPADRDAIMGVSGEAWARRVGKVWDEGDAEGWRVMAANKVVVTELSGPDLEEVRKRLAPLETRWIERMRGLGVDGAAALDYFRAEVRREEG